jgi:predicted nucleotidyltransferase
MEKAAERLNGILEERARLLAPEIQRRLRLASQVVIFGSFAACVETPSSDLDVFCVGECRTHFKTRAIEILILPEYDLYSDLWLGSELASHISSYGIPLDTRPDWFSHAAVTSAAADRKERRINAYARSLEMYWRGLGSGAKYRYEIKIKRELQRLQLLRNGEPVPPTLLLDRKIELLRNRVAAPSTRAPDSLEGRFRTIFAGITGTGARRIGCV